MGRSTSANTELSSGETSNGYVVVPTGVQGGDAELEQATVMTRHDVPVGMSSIEAEAVPFAGLGG
jgi:hypothetical protein